MTRRLSAEERALWRKVVATVRPLANAAAPDPEPEADAPAPRPTVPKPVSIARATARTINGTTPWTPHACCSPSIPVAQGDISPAITTTTMDKTLAAKGAA